MIGPVPGVFGPTNTHAMVVQSDRALSTTTFVTREVVARLGSERTMRPAISTRTGKEWDRAVCGG
jgi:hypothetical protein